MPTFNSRGGGEDDGGNRCSLGGSSPGVVRALQCLEDVGAREERRVQTEKKVAINIQAPWDTDGEVDDEGPGEGDGGLQDNANAWTGMG